MPQCAPPPPGAERVIHDGFYKFEPVLIGHLSCSLAWGQSGVGPLVGGVHCLSRRQVLRRRVVPSL